MSKRTMLFRHRVHEAGTVEKALSHSLAGANVSKNDKGQRISGSTVGMSNRKYNLLKGSIGK